ncbi:hypothetical protein D9615_005601 [Tricholomella constricta]|uniref:Uncharacterized protein n=1 Tax=Tricholomella constricta TaxID=117010 RepID=A0A8H5HDV1_9AGAR|nr:hypothetical protein D9615_005601 [Tricholomella constricta]
MSQDREISKSLSMRKYLSKAFLPALKRSTSKHLLTNQIKRAAAWPQYAEMQKRPGMRILNEILRTDTVQFVTLVWNYLENTVAKAYILNENMVIEEESPHLRLPSKDVILYDDDDIKFFSSIDNEEILLKVMQNYILGTVSEALRIINKHPSSSAAAAALQFHDYSRLCRAHRARWDILALPGTKTHPLPFFVFFIPPWEFGTEDFTEFTEVQRFQNGDLDAPTTTVQKLWAVIHDTCRHRGRFFVVSNYTRWAFGEISPDDRKILITAPFEAPILHFDGTYKATQALGCNAVEMLVFWMAWALGHGRATGTGTGTQE